MKLFRGEEKKKREKKKEFQSFNNNLRKEKLWNLRLTSSNLLDEAFG